MGLTTRTRSPSLNNLAKFYRAKGRQRRISTKERDRKKAQRLADEYEKASRTKRTLRQAQAVLDRLHEELSGERVVRTSMRQYLDDWFDGKKAETAPSTMAFWRGLRLAQPLPSFQRCVFKTAASLAAPAREAVISVLTLSRNCTR
jgi:hypothetical protein